jgi:P27 family predicted phage terminase small subunit
MDAMTQTPPVVCVARTPRAPRWLAPEARAFWRAVAPELVRLGVLHPVLDVPLLEMTAEHYGLWRSAVAAYLVAADPAEREQLRQIAHKQAGVWLQCAAEFGLTPASRKQLRAAVTTGQDAAGAWLALFRPSA